LPSHSLLLPLVLVLVPLVLHTAKALNKWLYLSLSP
jgi:hypothetical protein